MGKKLSIIIPAHNEGGRIAKTLEAYLAFFKEKLNKDFEIVVVTNNCKDNTVEVVKKAAKKNRQIIILDFKQGGKGFAIKEGFKYSLSRNFDLIGFVDADMATGPESFYDLVVKIGNYDGVLASRYVRGAELKPKQTFVRILVSRIGNYIIRGLFLINIRDTQCGAKLFKRRAIEKILPRLEMSQWAIDVDILYNLRKFGFRVKEIPTVWKDMPGSKLNIKKSSLQVLLAIIQLRMLNSPIKRMWGLIAPFAGLLYRFVK